MSLARSSFACGVVLLLAALAVSNSHAQQAARPAVVRITIRDMAFTPANATANIGDTIEWTNADIVDHTATATHKAWDVVIPTGKTVRVTMKKPGAFDYFCRFHPNMKARIVVRKSGG